jgi:hypothetical protein
MHFATVFRSKLAYFSFKYYTWHKYVMRKYVSHINNYYIFFFIVIIIINLAFVWNQINIITEYFFIVL